MTADYFASLKSCLDGLQIQQPRLQQALKVLYQAYRKGKTVFIIGNGGSSATASHFACDLTKTTRKDGELALRAVCLSDNVSLLTAYSNDIDYESAFRELLRTYAMVGGVLICFSVSGDSANILAAARYAVDLGLATIAFTGIDGGKLAPLVELAIKVPSRDYGQVEDMHLILAHYITAELKKMLGD